MAAKAEDEVNIALAFKLYILNFLMGVSYCVSNCVIFSCSAYILTIYVAMLLIDEFHLHICRIFQFQNFKRTKKRVLEEDEVDGVCRGCVLCIELRAVLEFFLVETTFIVGINLLVAAVLTALHAFSLVAS